MKPKLSYAIDLDLNTVSNDIKRYLPEKFKFAGGYNFSGKITGTEKDFVVSGKASSKKGNIYGIEFADLSLDIRVDPDGLTVEKLDGKLFGGDVTGRYSMPFSTAPDFTAKLSLSGTTIDDIEKGCPALPRLLRGGLNGTLEATGKFKGGYYIDVKADLASPKFVLYKDLYAKKDKNEERFVFNNMKLKTSLNVSKKGLYFDDLSLTTDDFAIDVSGSMPKYKNLALDFTADINNLGVIKVPAGIDKELIGAALVKGSLRDRAADPDISITFTAFNVLYDNLLIDRIDGGATYKDKLILFKKISALKNGYDFTANGYIDIKNGAQLSLDIDINKADLADLNDTISELRINRVAALDNFSGAYTGDVKIRGSAKNPKIDFNVSSDKIMLYKNEVSFNVEGQATKESVKISKAKVKKGDIDLKLGGDIDYKKGLDLEYSFDEVYVEDVLKSLGKEVIDFNAKVVSGGKVAGGFDDVKVTSKVVLTNIMLKELSLKDSDFNLIYDKTGVSVSGDFFNSELKFDLKLSGDKFDRVSFKSDLDGFEPDTIFDAFFTDKNIRCILNGRVELDTKFDYKNLTKLDHYLKNSKKFEADLKISDLSTNKYRFEESTVYLSYKDKAGNVSLKVLKDKIEFMSHFEYDGNINTVNNLYIGNLKVSDIKKYIEGSEGIEGKVDVSLNFKLNNLLTTKGMRSYLSNLRDINGAININDIKYNTYPIGEFCLNLTTKNDILKLGGVCHGSLLKIDGEVNYSGKKDYRISVATSKVIDYPDFLKKFKIRLPEEIKGETKLNLLITGNLDDYETFVMEIGADPFTIRTGELEFKNDGELKVALVNDTFHVRSFKLKEKNSRFSFSGSIDNKKEADLKIDGMLNLLFVKPFLPKAIERFEGSAVVTLNIKGKLTDPEIFGSFKLSDALLGLTAFPENFENINGKGIFSKKSLTIENVTAELNKTPVVITGDIMKGKDEPLTLNIAIDYERLNLTYPEDVETDTTANLKLEGPVKDLTLSGTVEIINLEYTKPIKVFTVEDFVNFFKRFKKRKTEPIREEKKKIGLKFDIAIIAEEDNIKIDNNIVKCKLKGNLDLVGDVANAVVLGSLEITSGKILTKPFDDFEFTSGIINFSNEAYIKPAFDITVEKDIESVSTVGVIYPVTVNFSGDTEDPVITYSSPGLNSDEVIKLVTLGMEPTKSEEEQRKQAEVGIYKLVSDEISNELSKQFGTEKYFDKFTIEPYYSKSSESTSAQLVVGKDLDELAEGLSVEYSTDVSGTNEQNAEVEYPISNNFSVVGDWDNQAGESKGSFGGDLRFRFNFR